MGEKSEVEPVKVVKMFAGAGHPGAMRRFVKKTDGVTAFPATAAGGKRRGDLGKFRGGSGFEIRRRPGLAGTMKPGVLAVWVAWGLAGAAGSGAAEPVAVAAKPAGPWRDRPTRTLDDLPAVVSEKRDTGLTRFGGRGDGRVRATGFFRTERIGGRWWLVDPEGGRFVHRAVVSVQPLRTPGAQAAQRAKFGDDAQWAAATAAWLAEHGFNGLGAWTDPERFRATPRRLAYAPIWNFMSAYGRKRGGTYQLPGHTGYPQNAIFVFDPEFEAFCTEHARQLGATKDDPWLLGHFTDNELPLRREALANFLALPETDPGHRAARAFLEGRRGAGATAQAITEPDRQDFLALVVDRYLGIVTRAIRAADPNHLVLGSRFHGAQLRLPETFRAAGPHLDVVAVNYYHAWSADPELTAMWARESGKPWIVTEWYAKGMDAPGLANVSGAGFVVKTQADRGKFYENFTLSLLESRDCVGWHWFKYIDNDPDDTKADPSNRDSNKGIVSNRYEPYADLLRSMRRINERAYGLIEYFDGGREAGSGKQGALSGKR